MAQVLTNNTGLAFARETTLGVLPGSPDWKTLEPNSQGAFGSVITTTPRTPISNLRQDRQGTTTDLDASNDFEADQTFDTLHDFTEMFLFATAVNADMTFRGVPSVASTGFTIDAATAAQAAKFQFTAAGPISLLHIAGYATASTNSGTVLVPLTSDLAASGTTLPVTGIVTSEGTPPSNAEVSVAGIRCAEIGDLALAVASGVGTLTSGNGTAATNAVDFTTLGLTLGQKVYVGGFADANRFGSTAAADGTRSFGSARVTAIAAGTLTLDKLDATLVASDGTDDGNAGTEIATDLLFGRFVRNVSVSSAEFNRISATFESHLPDLHALGTDGYEYVRGAIANLMTWNMPLTSKSTASFAFIAQSADESTSTRETGAAAARSPLFTGAMNTSADFFRLGVFDIDETGLTSDFKNMTCTINNNVTGEKVLGFLGSKYINNGNFQVQVEGSVLFTERLVAVRIRNNTRVTMDWLVTNDDGAVSVDIPSAYIEGGAKEYPVDATVQIGLTIKAFVDATLQTSIGVSFFPAFPIV